jgi:hypothetical protein
MKILLTKMGFLPFLAILLVGCGSNPSTTTPVSSNSSGLALDTAIEQAAARMEKAFNPGTEIALISVSSPSVQFSEYVLTYLESILVNNGKLAIVDRANLDKIRAEQGFQLSGEVSDASAKAIGQLLGAGAIVTGTLVNLGDAYRLTLKAINVETARVAASYPADIANSPRVQTLLASGGGTSAGTQTVQRGTASGNTPAQAAASDPGITIKVIAKKAGTLYFENKEIASLFEGDEYVITLTGSGSYMVKMRFSNGAEMEKKVIINKRGITSVTMDDHYSIGDQGPAGGWIFYDKGFVSDGWRYLEAAPVEVEVTGIEAGTWDPSGTSLGTGSGKKNTERLVNYHEENGQTGKAAQLSSALVYNGYDDWFLPSQAELDLMYRNLKSNGLGGFSSGWYCSSSAASYGMRAQKFSDGTLGATNWNGVYDHAMDSSRVRSVRAF